MLNNARTDAEPPEKHWRRRSGRDRPGRPVSPGPAATSRASATLVELMPNNKGIERLSELVPQARVIALLVNPNGAGAEAQIRIVQEAARAKGVQLPILKAGTEGEIDAAFASLVELHAGALLVGGDPFFASRREQLVALASRHTVPASYMWKDFAAAGGLIRYGVNPLFSTAAGRTGQLTDRRMTRTDALRMIWRRAAAAGIATELSCHSFRATGITVYLKKTAGSSLTMMVPMCFDQHQKASTHCHRERRCRISLQNFSF
jgi:ABC transporter substrate binding protein